MLVLTPLMEPDAPVTSSLEESKLTVEVKEPIPPPEAVTRPVTVKVLPGETLEEEGERRMEPETAKAVMLPPSTRIKDKTAMIICCNFFFMYETFS